MNKRFLLLLLPFLVFACYRKTIKEKGQAIGDQLESGEQIKIPDALPRFIGKIEAKDTLPQNLDTLLFYQRTACFGFCPTFNYTLFNNGAVLYQGIMHVQNPGRFWGLMAEDEWLKLMEKVNKINFFKLSSVYPPNEREFLPDLPNKNILIKEYGLRKFITDNHSSPAQLKELEDMIESKFQMIINYQSK
ncbi:MAG: hypothetical protein IPP06_13540 [Saprospiraceae bacterium]|nr:hypothetical protein [Candidatus Vicinibacter affinis]